jgi:hypothetical protein
MEGTPNHSLMHLQQQMKEFELEIRNLRSQMENEKQAWKEQQARVSDTVNGDFSAREAALAAREKRLAELEGPAKGDHLKANHKILLDVGGRRFSTTRTTLAAEPSSMLAAMFSGRHQLQKDEEGYYFIDRNGDCFGYILDWLRMRQLPPGLTVAQLHALKIEADYYQLEGLSNALRNASTFHGIVFRLTVGLQNGRDNGPNDFDDFFLSGTRQYNDRSGLVYDRISVSLAPVAPAIQFSNFQLTSSRLSKTLFGGAETMNSARRWLQSAIHQGFQAILTAGFRIETSVAADIDPHIHNTPSHSLESVIQHLGTQPQRQNECSLPQMEIFYIAYPLYC